MKEQLTELSPFGLLVHVSPDTEFSSLSLEKITAWMLQHKVVLIRGLKPMTKEQMPMLVRELGPLQAWPFGAVHEIYEKPNAKNYLYTSHQVPLHFDGAFAKKIPKYLVFQCVAAPQETGGETVFVDTTLVWKQATKAEQDLWSHLRFSYETEKIVHYGGRFATPLVAKHPDTQETILRFAEPVADINPVSVTLQGVSADEQATILTQLTQKLTKDNVTLSHRWESGDFLIADNFALLHGRKEYQPLAPRHLLRVNILSKKRTWLDAWKDSLRIRRPEFWVAEIPIFLIPALLLAPTTQALFSFPTLLGLFLFFLLFHLGDMVNCLADCKRDLMYKTHLAEAVYGLGKKNVKIQIGVTAATALMIAAVLSVSLHRPSLFLLIIFGMLWAVQYSVKPLQLKGKGLWQVITLWGILFFGPMLFVALLFSNIPSWPYWLLFASYGALQQGIVLINTAEDIPEDQTAHIQTVVLSLGLLRTLSLAMGLVGIGGNLLVFSYVLIAQKMATFSFGFSILFFVSVLALVISITWVFLEIGALRKKTLGLSSLEQVKKIREVMKRMPVWLKTTAWAACLCALVLFLFKV